MPEKLQRILYFIASEYSKTTGNPLFSEQFSTYSQGHALQSVYDNFRPFNNKNIPKYKKSPLGEVHFIPRGDHVLNNILEIVWGATKYLDTAALTTNIEGSSWYQEYQQEKKLLDDECIHKENTYSSFLEFTLSLHSD